MSTKCSTHFLSLRIRIGPSCDFQDENDSQGNGKLKCNAFNFSQYAAYAIRCKLSEEFMHNVIEILPLLEHSKKQKQLQHG